VTTSVLGLTSRAGDNLGTLLVSSAISNSAGDSRQRHEPHRDCARVCHACARLCPPADRGRRTTPARRPYKPANLKASTACLATADEGIE
jgi:hypothetical protein